MSPLAALLLPLLLLAAGAAALWLVRRPMAVLAILVSGTTLFDQFLMGPDFLLYVPVFYDNLNKTLGIGGLVIDPIEILLALLAAGWLSQAVSGRCPGRPLRATAALGVLWFLCVALAAWWGVANGGNGKIGLWILRPVAYFLAVAFLAYQIVRSPRQVAWLFALFLACVATKAAVTVWLWMGHHRDVPGWECYVSHEDTSFALYALWFAAGCFLYGLRGRLAGWSLALTPLLAAAVVFNDRRINFVTGLLGVALVLVATPASGLIRRGLWLGGAAAAGLLYVACAAVGPENAATRPVKGIITGLQAEAEGRNTDTSSQYRKLERYDLVHTVRAYPVLGAGLGVKYLQPIQLPKLTFDYAVYITHNQVVMTHAMMGPVAYLVLLVLYVVLFTQMLVFSRRLREPWQRCLAVAAAAAVANWLIVGYYDMQLFFFRNSIVAGMAVALPACLMRWQEEQDVRGQPC